MILRSNGGGLVRYCPRLVHAMAVSERQNCRYVLPNVVFTQIHPDCVVVLDEAHKYLINSDTARLTQSISSIIRLQRHLATRIIIVTQVGHHLSIVTRSSWSPLVQEPTVIPSTMLDLASFVFCHRFTSPSWCRHLARHVSASDNDETAQWFQDVMLLATGQCVVFSPSALIMTSNDSSVRLLGRDYLKLRVRPRLTLDGGTSLLAVGRTLPSIQ